MNEKEIFDITIKTLSKELLNIIPKFEEFLNKDSHYMTQNEMCVRLIIINAITQKLINNYENNNELIKKYNDTIRNLIIENLETITILKR